MSGRRPIWPNGSRNKFGRALRAKILLILPKTEFFNSIGGKRPFAAFTWALLVTRRSGPSLAGCFVGRKLECSYVSTWSQKVFLKYRCASYFLERSRTKTSSKPRSSGGISASRLRFSSTGFLMPCFFFPATFSFSPNQRTR